MSRPFWMIVICILLAGCQQPGIIPPVPHDRPLALSGSDAALVVGVSLVHREMGLSDRLSKLDLGRRCFQDYGIARFDARVGQIMPLEVTRWCERCEMQTPFGFGFADPSAEACAGGVNYELYKLPAGDYAFAYLLRDMKAVLPVRLTGYRFYAFYGYIQRGLSGGTLRADTPVLTLNPSDVIYAGDVIFDLAQKDNVTWTFGSTPAGARRFIDGTGLAGRMVERPWKPFGRTVEPPITAPKQPDNVTTQ